MNAKQVFPGSPGGCQQARGQHLHGWRDSRKWLPQRGALCSPTVGPEMTGATPQDPVPAGKTQG